MPKVMFKISSSNPGSGPETWMIASVGPLAVSARDQQDFFLPSVLDEPFIKVTNAAFPLVSTLQYKRPSMSSCIPNDNILQSHARENCCRQGLPDIRMSSNPGGYNLSSRKALLMQAVRSHRMLAFRVRKRHPNRAGVKQRIGSCWMRPPE